MHRILLPLTEPIGMVWLLLMGVAGIQLRKRRWGTVAMLVAILGACSLIGSTPLSARLLASLEQPYAHTDLDKLPEHDAVVMLGGVLEASANDPLGLNLHEAADRIVTVAELLRRHKANALVLGGGDSPTSSGRQEESGLVEHWLRLWNLAQAPIYRLGVCADTRDEAVRTAALAREKKWSRIILVTSAGHMRRAKAVFRKQGLRPTCVACDFNGLSELQTGEVPGLVPKEKGFSLFGLYSHEWIGWWYYRLRGWL